jgi:hypothetical protein
MPRSPAATTNTALEIKPAIYHALLSKLKDGFCIFHELAFDSFKLCVLHPTFLFCRIVLFFFARAFWFLKWG